MISNVILCLLISQISLVLALRTFHLGRKSGGNLGAPINHYRDQVPEEQWFEQKLDHFSPTDLRTWKQLYYVNGTFSDRKNLSTVFLMIGGEGPFDARWMVRGAWMEYANTLGALCFGVEHRYYGKSHPVENLSVKNLIYLSSQQGLADLAAFIAAMKLKHKINDEVKWIVFGGSYPGSLAAWMRLKYPHLVYAAVSSSGPLYAKVNFKEYFESVVASLEEKTGNEECVNALKTAQNEIQSLINSQPKKIDEQFRLCNSLTKASNDDVKNFHSSLADNWAGLVQYNEDHRISFDERFQNYTINNVCNILTEPGQSNAYQRLATFNAITLAKNNKTCLDYSYTNMINELRSVKWSEGEGGRQWTYQTCTEFGFFQTSSAESEVFGNDFVLDFYVQQCKDIFGVKFDKGFIETSAAWTNSVYGSVGIEASRILYVHGSIDPWHVLGITKSQENDSPAIFIKGTAHCANMYPSSSKDSAELTMARTEILQILSNWVKIIAL